VVCDGPLNVHWVGNRATITFTHPRAKPEPMFEKEEIQIGLVVRARIATSIENLIGMRDLLIRLFPPDKPNVDTASSGGGASFLH
jgi:hypothetical protein